MLSLATGIKTVETDSEIEALIMESQYIKRYKPAFNIMLRDDKQFGFVGFTHSTHSNASGQASSGQAEDYPKIFITHQPKTVSSFQFLVSRNSDKLKTKHYKPETSYIGPFTDMGALKTTLRYLRQIFPYCTCKQLHNNFCLNYHIGKCVGFCCLKNQAVSNKQKVIRDYKKNIKVIKDILSGKKNYLLKNLEKEMVKLGKEAARSDNRSERASLKEREKFNEAIELRNKIEKIKRVFENAKIIKSIDISKYQYENVLVKLQHFFGLSQTPTRIEGYDVANIQGKHAVGTMVVFTDGRPNKNEYRKFKIYTKNTPDDTAMLKEILIRRFNHPDWKFPDLILMDGGKTQLSAALKVISNYNLLIAVVALTKDERHRGNKIYITRENDPISLSKLPANVKNLLLQIDAEAHRFAISYYRKLHIKDVK
jgi:excinuclease ABC subunit C